MQIIAFGFLGVIFLGSILLYLPISNQEPIAYLDALFVSVSAVCVTGLVTVVPAVQFTVFGKIILLLLIQIGGLGVIACTMAVFLAIRKKITMKSRVMIQQTYNLETLSGLVRFIIRILKGTVLVEGIGAVLFAFYLCLSMDLSGDWHMGSSILCPHSVMQELIYWHHQLYGIC